MNIKYILIGIIVICIVIIAIWIPFNQDIINKNYCNANSDCVPEQCCHAISCINENFAPNCSDTVCSSECAPDTMDCDQGSCECVNNNCQAIINNLPDNSSNNSL